MKKDVCKIIFSIIGILILSPTITYLIALFFSKFHLIKQIGFVDTWISFSGSIIGGAITMVALIFTVKEQQKANKINAEIQSRPYVFCQIDKYSGNFKRFNSSNKNDYEGEIFWKMANSSNNVAERVRIIDEKLYLEDTNGNNDTELKDLTYIEDMGISIYTVLAENYYYIVPYKDIPWKTTISIDKPIFYQKNKSGISLKNVIFYEYRNAQLDTIYHWKFSFTVFVSIDVDNKLSYLIEDISNTAVKQFDVSEGKDENE